MPDSKLAVASVIAIAVSAPGLALAQQQGGQSAEEPQVAEQCLQDLQAFNQELIDAGYGVAMPPGAAGVAPADGTPVGAAAPATDAAPVGAGYGVVSPRGDMRVMMQSAYVFARLGEEEACQAVLGGMREVVEEHGDRLAAGGRAGDLEAWRGDLLAAAVPVSELGGPIRADRIIGADVRNLEDEDLGDIDDVIFGAGGEIQYVLVSRGGFLGVGEDRIPVRWQDLKMSPSPYQSTFVLDVPEGVFDNAPTVDGDAVEQTAEQDWGERVNQFWDENVEG